MTNSILNQNSPGAINGQAPGYGTTFPSTSQGLSAITPQKGSLLDSFWSGNLFSWTPKEPSEQVKMCKTLLNTCTVTGECIDSDRIFLKSRYTYSKLKSCDNSYELTINVSEPQINYTFEITFNTDNTVSVKQKDGPGPSPVKEHKLLHLKPVARTDRQTLSAIANHICYSNCQNYL